ncbi:MAG TPA: hypothetical protein VJ921_02755, partial [Vicinamibacteria bacterium]|nr:hypothetical protein [Vicinamibacteria bacterium]
MTFRIALLAALVAVVPLGASLFRSEALAARWARSRQPRTTKPIPRTMRPRGIGAAPDVKFLRHIMPRLGSDAAFRKVAKTLGVKEWRGKSLDKVSTPSDSFAMTMALDTPVDSFDGSQNQPSIAADPTDESVVVVLAQNESNFLSVPVACSIYVSFDAGVSFTYFDDAPLLNPDDTCAEPLVRFSPDGLNVYFSYLSIRNDGSSSDIVVSIADGDFPETIVTGPTVVIPGGADFVDKPSLGVHTFDNADGDLSGSSYVYVVGTLFAGADCAIVVNASDNYGASWFTPGGDILNNSTGCDTGALQGPRVAAGPGGQVLICYFNAGADGLSLIDPVTSPSNRFQITCNSSADRLNTISTPFNAVVNSGYELNFFLGPNEAYHRWFPGMFPSIAIDHRGNAHITFAMDPTAKKLDAESGNVMYVRSTAGAVNPPYRVWTPKPPLALGTGPRAQGFPNVVAQRSNLTINSYIYVAYYDHYRSPVTAPNLFYDVRYRRSVNGGIGFGAPVTVTDVV